MFYSENEQQPVVVAPSHSDMNSLKAVVSDTSWSITASVSVRGLFKPWFSFRLDSESFLFACLFEQMQLNKG